MHFMHWNHSKDKFNITNKEKKMEIIFLDRKYNWMSLKTRKLKMAN